MRSNQMVPALGSTSTLESHSRYQHIDSKIGETSHHPLLKSMSSLFQQPKIGVFSQTTSSCRKTQTRGGGRFANRRQGKNLNFPTS
eukprot:4551950-Amphidinium_carterae.1